MSTTNTFRRGDIVRDCYGKTHEVIDAYGCVVHTYDGDSFHPARLFLVFRARGRCADIINARLGARS